MASHSSSSPDPSRRPSLSRTPQPYLRQQAELPDRIHINRSAQLYTQPPRHDPGASQPSSNFRPRVRPQYSSGYFSSHSQKASRARAASSDSGTEADDEKPLLKALTAPPPQPRKGLKIPRGSSAENLSSPLLTPSFLEKERSRLERRQEREKRRGSGKAVSEEDTQQARARQKRRQRAEYARRILETALLLAVGVLSWTGGLISSAEGTEASPDTSLLHVLMTIKSCGTTLRLWFPSTQPILSSFYGISVDSRDYEHTSTGPLGRIRRNYCTLSFFHCAWLWLWV